RPSATIGATPPPRALLMIRPGASSRLCIEFSWLGYEKIPVAFPCTRENYFIQPSFIKPSLSEGAEIMPSPSCSYQTKTAGLLQAGKTACCEINSRCCSDV